MHWAVQFAGTFGIAVLGWSLWFGGRLPGLYRARACQGRSWRHRFPKASKQEIREFLTIFVASFALYDDQKLKLNPDDEIAAIYRALNPSRLLPDVLEFEALTDRIDGRYQVSLAAVWHERCTLGELYSSCFEAP